jgi:nitrogen fixation NifU-like protein
MDGKAVNIYQERLLDHYRSSAYRGVVDNPEIVSGAHNPSCGDALSLTGRIEKDILVTLMFQGVGCIISQAAASLLCEELRGKSLTIVAQYDSDSMKTLVGIPLGPTRLKCVLLPLEALRIGLCAYQERRIKGMNAQSCQIDARDTTGCH